MCVCINLNDTICLLFIYNISIYICILCFYTKYPLEHSYSIKMIYLISSNLVTILLLYMHMAFSMIESVQLLYSLLIGFD